jgi:hypothetical protein
MSREQIPTTEKERAVLAFRALRPSLLTLLAALSGLLTLALVGFLLFTLIKGAQPNRPSTALPGNAYITTAQTAAHIHSDGSAADATVDFAINQTVYIAYMVNDAGPGVVTVKLYNNGGFFAEQTHTFSRRSSYNAYFLFQPPSAGEWDADLYWRAPGAAGDGSLEQRVTFLVGETSRQHGNVTRNKGSL